MNKLSRSIVFAVTFGISFLAVKLILGEPLSKRNIMAAAIGAIVSGCIIYFINPQKKK
jgi:DMSO reductase anchor subunit